MLGNPLGSVLESVLPFLLHPNLTLGGHFPGFLVGHSEDVVGVHSSIHSAVPWDWLIELFHLFIDWQGDRTEKVSGGFFDCLLGGGLCWGVNSGEGFCLFLVKFIVFFADI